MTIGSATSSHPISYTPSPTASTKSNPSDRKQDDDRDDAVTKAEVAPAKSPPAAVGKGLGLLIDISL